MKISLTTIRCASQLTKIYSRRLTWWPKQKSERKLEQRDTFRTPWTNWSQEIGNSIRKWRKIPNNRKMQWPYTIVSSSEASKRSFHANSHTWLFHKHMNHILENMQRKHQISQYDSLLARSHYLGYLEFCWWKESCQLNRHNSGKTLFTGPKADVWQRVHVDLGYVEIWVFVDKDEG